LLIDATGRRVVPSSKEVLPLAKWLCAVFLAWTLGNASGALAQVDSPLDAAVTIHVSTNLVMLDVLVENKSGTPIDKLQSGDFLLSEDGIPQTITYFSQDRLPLSVVFLFDLTDTVRGALKPLAKGALQVLDHLKPEDEVAILVFSSHTEILQPFTTDRTRAAAAIANAAGMKTTDGTFIHESMYEAVEEAMRSTTPGSRRVMVWLTDGSANSQNATTQKMFGKGAPAVLHDQREATQALLHSGVVVSAMIETTAATDMARVNPFMLIVGAHMGDIRRYAALTGGPVLDTSKDVVAARLATLLDQLRMRYTLGYKPSTTRPPGSFCKLDVRLSPHATIEGDRKKLRILARQGYYR